MPSTIEKVGGAPGSALMGWVGLKGLGAGVVLWRRLGSSGPSSSLAAHSSCHSCIYTPMRSTTPARVSVPLTVSATCVFKDRREGSSSATRVSTAVRSKFRDVDKSRGCHVVGPGIRCCPLTSTNSWLLCCTCLFKDAHFLSNWWTGLENGCTTSTFRRSDSDSTSIRRW